MSLTPLFNPVESPTDGQILVELRYQGSSFEILPESHRMQADIGILVLGV